MSTLALLRARANLIALAQPSTAYCRTAGIDWRRTETATGGLFLAPVVADPPRSFLIDPMGAEAVVIDAFDEGGRTIDLVSWRPGYPDNWRTFLGRAPALGMRGATIAYTYNNPLRLWRTPDVRSALALLALSPE